MKKPLVVSAILGAFSKLKQLWQILKSAFEPPIILDESDTEIVSRLKLKEFAKSEECLIVEVLRSDVELTMVYLTTRRKAPFSFRTYVLSKSNDLRERSSLSNLDFDYLKELAKHCGFKSLDYRSYYVYDVAKSVDAKDYSGEAPEDLSEVFITRCEQLEDRRLVIL